MARLRRNNTYFDLDKFEPFYSIGANDIGELHKRAASYTVDFQLPWTQTNKILLNNIGEPNLSNNPANKKIDNVFLEIDHVIYKGTIRVNNVVPNRYFDVYFTSGVSDWVDEIKGVKLQDINLSEYNHTYDVDSIKNSMTNTEGYIYPLINYGFWNDIFNSFDTFVLNTVATLYNNWFPAVYDKTILEKIFSDAGWSVDTNSELLKEPRFKNQVTVFSNGKFQYRTEDIDRTRVPMIYLDVTGITITTTPTKIPFTYSTINTGIPLGTNQYLFNDATNEYTVPFDGLYRLDRLRLTSTTSDAHEFTVEAYVNGVASGVTAGFNQNGFDFFQDSYDVSPFEVSVAADDLVDFRLVKTGATPDPNITQVQARDNTMAAVFSLTDIVEIPYGGRFNLASYLPDITQDEFVKDIINQYGCYIVTDEQNKTVRFDLFKTLSGKKFNAIDWTDKVDASLVPSVDYSTLSSRYGKINEYKYKQDESERNLNEEYTPLDNYNSSYNVVKLGDSEFDVDNDFVSARKVVYDSPFGSSIEEYVGRDTTLFGRNSPKLMYIPYAKKTYNEGVGGTAVDITITLQEISTFRKAIVLVGTDLTELLQTNLVVWNPAMDTAQNIPSAPYAYFVKETKGIDDIDNTNYCLSWSSINKFNSDNGLLDDYYEDQINIIRAGEKVVARFILKESDLQNIDLSIPRYLNTPTLSGYYLINKIPKLNTLNRPIEVELIKLP